MQNQMNVVQYVEPRQDLYLFRTGNQFLTTTDLTPLQLQLVTYIFIALGVAIVGSLTYIKCATSQSLPMFMTQQILDQLSEHRVKYAIIIHNRRQDIYPDHNTVFIEWTSRVHRDLAANVHIYPSKTLWERGIIENALVNNLARSTLNLHENHHLIGLPPEVAENWIISPVLQVINRNTGETLKFYIKHLFEDRLKTDWLTADSTHLGPDIIDIRGYLIRKASENMLDLYPMSSSVHPYNIPQALEHLIDIINETWLPLLL